MPAGSGAGPPRFESGTTLSLRTPSLGRRPAPRSRTSAPPGRGGRASRCRRRRGVRREAIPAPRSPPAAPGCSRSDLSADRARPLLGLALLLVGRADQDRDLAEVLVLVEELVRIRDAVEPHDPPEHRLDLALRHQLVGPHALVGVCEVRPDDLLLAHPQVADVEVERVARGRAADHHLSERLDDEDRGRERRLADVLEDDVRRVAEDPLDPLRELARDLEARLLRLAITEVLLVPHHPRELAAVDVVDRTEPLDQLALLVRRDDAHDVRA